MKHILFMFLAFLATTFDFSYAADWPHTRFDAVNTGFNPHEQVLGPSNVGSLEILWTNSSPCTIRQGVSVANGVVYYGHYCGEFRAVDAATGAMLWAKSLDGKDQGHAVVDGVAYVTSIGAAYAFDAASGATLWTWDPGAPRLGGVRVSNGVVYTNTDDDIFYALDASTGGELWNVPISATIWTFSVTDGAAYVIASDGLRAHSLENGTLLWIGLLPEGQGVGSVVTDGVVYVHSDAGIMYAFDADGCDEEFCAPLWRGLTQVQTGGDGTRPPAVGEGKVYVGANNTFYAFPADGCGVAECNPLWTKTTACSFFSGSPSVANGVVYSPCGNDYIFAFDASNGDILWEYFASSSGYPIRSTPAIVDGRLYHDATFDFTLYAFHVPGAVPEGPVPDIKANDSDGPVFIVRGTPLQVDVSLVSNDATGQAGDWWLMAETPDGRLWYDQSGSWVKSMPPILAYEGDLLDITSITVLNSSDLSIGSYSVYFGVDTNANRVLDFDVLFADSVDVNIRGK